MKTILKKKLYFILFQTILFFCTINVLYAQIRIKAVGDVMPGSITPTRQVPSDLNIFSLNLGDVLKGADICFGNLEGSFIQEGMKTNKCSEESRLKGHCYEFGIPAELAPVLKDLGFSVFNLDNNHCEDYGNKAITNTKEILRQQGIAFAGQQEYCILNIKNKKVALVAFGFSDNSYNISDLSKTKEVIQNLKNLADIVIVSFHGGAEGKKARFVKDEQENFLGENRGNVVKFSRTAIDAGASLVLGHGPHILRAIEIYKGKLIAYSLGNFLTYGHFNLKELNGISVILDVGLNENTGDFYRGKLIPVKQKEPGIPYVDDENSGIIEIKNLTEKFTDSVYIEDDGTIIKSKEND